MISPVQSILTKAESLGLRLVVVGDSIRFRPKSAMTQQLAELITANRSAVLDALRSTDATRLHNPANHREIETSVCVDSELFCESQWPDDSIEVPPACSVCGGLELWQPFRNRLSLVDPPWRCLRCDPPLAADRLLAATERIRRASAQRARKKGA